MAEPLHAAHGAQSGIGAEHVHCTAAGCKISRLTVDGRKYGAAFPEQYIQCDTAVDAQSGTTVAQFHAGLQGNIEHAEAVERFQVLFSVFHPQGINHSDRLSVDDLRGLADGHFYGIGIDILKYFRDLIVMNAAAQQKMAIQQQGRPQARTK